MKQYHISPYFLLYSVRNHGKQCNKSEFPRQKSVCYYWGESEWAPTLGSWWIIKQQGRRGMYYYTSGGLKYFSPILMAIHITISWNFILHPSIHFCTKFSKHSIKIWTLFSISILEFCWVLQLLLLCWLFCFVLFFLKSGSSQHKKLIPSNFWVHQTTTIFCFGGCKVLVFN